MRPRYRPRPRRVKLRGKVRILGGSFVVHGHWTGIAAAIALAALPALAQAPDAGAPPVERFDTVVLDAGHGGEDEGAHGPGGLVEKELVLDVGRRLASRLRERELRVVMTRDDDRFVALEERFGIANDARGDLFISIHANATEDRSVSGVETFFLAVDASDEEARRVVARENEAFGGTAAIGEMNDPLNAILGDLITADYLMESNEFARLAQRGLSGEGANHSRGVKQAPFVVLQGVQMPSSLVEIGFVTNPAEAKRLRSAPARDRIAAALVDAVLEFGRRFDARRGVASKRNAQVAAPRSPQQANRAR
jgi:N-acetylmuramoyl-L-alanine amidase